MESNLYHISHRYTGWKVVMYNVSQVLRENYFEYRIIYTIIYQLTEEKFKAFWPCKHSICLLHIISEEKKERKKKNPRDICQWKKGKKSTYRERHKTKVIADLTRRIKGKSNLEWKDQRG